MNGPMWLYKRFPRLTHWWRRLARANYEREMALLPVLCDPTRTGVDVGAKVGMYTYRIRAHSSDVVAFEPIPLFHRMLAKVFDGRRGRIEPVALSAQPGRVTMRLPYDHTGDQQFGRATIEPTNPLANDAVARVEELAVEARTLDSYCWDGVGFIKIDVEGHELAVLDGATATLADHRPNLLIECNPEHQVDGPARLAAWLAAHDYQAAFVCGPALVPMEGYDAELHWRRHRIENFVAFHRARRSELLPLLADRLAQRR
jgi:FkbM family methyltransferase